MKGSKIPRIELNTVCLYQHYSMFMHNKLQYTWRGGLLWVCVWPAQLPVLTEVRAPCLLEQYPRYVPHRERAGRNGSSSSLSSFRRTRHYPLRPSLILHACYVSTPFQHFVFQFFQICLCYSHFPSWFYVLLLVVWKSLQIFSKNIFQFYIYIYIYFFFL